MTAALETFGRAVPVCTDPDLSRTDRPKWLRLRRQGIGGSDAANICGQQEDPDERKPHESRLAIYREKTSQGEPEDRPAIDNIPASRGLANEDYIARLYEEHTGLKTARVPMLRHPDASWRLANIDRVAIGTTDRALRGLEIKCPSAWNKSWWGGKVPAYAEIQCQWYMGVTGTDEWDLAVLQDVNFRVVTLHRDEGLLGRVVGECSLVWHDNMLAGVEPDPAPHEVKTWVAERWPEVTVEERDATFGEGELARRMERCDARVKALQLRRQQLEAELLLGLDGAEKIQGEGWSYSCKPRAGKPGWAAAAKELAQTLSDVRVGDVMVPELLRELAEKHRGKPSRSTRLNMGG
jgi:putative phage-type endonuclease